MALTVVLAWLKEATAGLHREAERYVRILDGGATLVEYRRYLQAMHGFHAPLERRFVADAQLDALGYRALARRKTPQLRADLEALGASPAGECALPALATPGHLLGAAYVTEGSTLGGRFILAHLPPALATVGATGFLEGYGRDTGRLWRAFADVLDRAIAEGVAEADVIVDGACATFAQLVAWLATFEARAELAVAS